MANDKFAYNGRTLIPDSCEKLFKRLFEKERTIETLQLVNINPK